jgi:hypothetical protein
MWKLGESWRKRRMIEVVEKVGDKGKGGNYGERWILVRKVEVGDKG